MIHPTAKVSEQVNRKCPRRKTVLQLSAPYTDPEPSNSPPQTTYIMHQNKSWKTLKADFGLKLKKVN